MRIGRSLSLSLSLLCLLYLLPVPAHAQYTDDSTLTGLPPFGSFHGSDFDSVLLQNGNLHVQIPILSLPMRNGKNFTWRYIYDTPAWQAEWFPNPLPTDPNNGLYRIVPLTVIQVEDAGWRLTNSARWQTTYNVNQVNCPPGPPPNPTYTAGYTVIDPDGTSHPFPLQVSNSGPGGPFCGGQLVKGPALDGSGMVWDVPNNIVYLKDGTRLSLATMTLTDSNGNPISPIGTNGVTVTNSPPVALPTPLGSTTGHSQYTTWTFKDSNGSVQTYQVTWGGFDNLTNMCHLVPHGSYACYEYQIPDARPISLTLPNGKSYQFAWQNNSVFELIGITLPTGASISYTYSDFALRQPPPPGTTRHVNVSWNIRRTVATRTVQTGSQSSQWTYGVGVGGGVVTNPDGSSESHTLSLFAIGGLSSSGRVETLITYSNAGGVVRTVQKDWTGEVGPYFVANLRVIRETTTLDNGQSSKVETDYDNTLSYTVPAANTTPILPSGTYMATRMDLREKREFDFNASLVRTTHYAYLHETNSTYVNLNIVDRPTSIFTYAGPSSGSPVAKTFYEYDVYTHPNQPMVASNAVQHSSTFTTSYTTRGNQTAVQRWRNTDNALLTTTNQYDDAGNLLSAIDPLTNKTSFDYTDSWSNASCAPSGQGKVLPTKITNAKGQFATRSYYSCSGHLSSTTDLNNLTSSMTYDLLGRTVQAQRPDGGQTTNCYTDVGGATCAASGPPFQLVTTKSISGSTNQTMTTVFDGLGRVSQSQLNSDPQGTIFTDTTYDSLDRVRSVSNPYRNGTDITSSPGTTTYAYDALSRKISEIYPDNSVLTTAYCGASTLVTDPTGKWRRSRSDALGRLVEVDEPNAPGAGVTSNGCPGAGEPIWVTSFTNDVLGNLTQVLQNGSHQRNFTYNSLSQMLTSTNPEVGTITYTYDADGSVATKKDARNITTTYGYDPLNRESSRTYSNGDPTITTTYDQSACLGLSPCQNIGIRTSMTDGVGSEAWSYQVDATNHRSVRVDQRTTTSSPSNITKTSTYYLDLAGNVTQAVYPTGRIVNYTFDSADRPSTATDAANGITYATGFKTSPGTSCLINVTCYTPQGTFYALAIGQSSSLTNGLNLTHTFNSRLQPSEFKASSSGGNAIDLTYGFMDPSTSKNAGHVYGITNNLDSTRSQTFTYDQLNRITSAQTTSNFSTSPAHCWGETYSVDPWGNLQTIAATTNSNYTSCSQESGFSQTANGNNHLPSFSYDVSGNTTNDGINSYTWDAESQLKVTAGSTYLYDGDGRRVAKANTATPPVPYKLYWYGSGGDILAETDAAGSTTAEYIFFGGKRVAMLPPNAISNGAFELGLQGWGTWGTGITTQLVTAPTSCHLGNNCLRLSSSTGGAGGANDSQQVPLTNGQTITWGGWRYLESGIHSYSRWGVGVYALNGDSNGAIAYLLPPNDSTLGTWIYQGGSFTVPSWAQCPCHATLFIDFTTSPTNYQNPPGPELNTARFDDGFITTGSTGGGSPLFYVEDMLGTSRVIAQSNGVVCYDADFYPFGGERPYTNTCPQNYKFEGKERDTETGNDDFGARYYSNRFGRWLSADWSAVPAPVPYANLTNPQTLNLYSMVGDDPETFADLDAHDGWDYTWGVLNALASNFVSTQRVENGNSDVKSGQALGDALSFTVGGAVAITTVVGSVTADVGSGGAALVLTPAEALVATTAANGALQGGKNLLKSSVENGSSGKPYENTPENKEQMKQGNAPTGTDGKPVELHHEGQKPNGPVKEMTRTEHRVGENFKKNHPNTGQKPSQINRNQAQQQKRKHWKNKANQQD
jgi:RHS repeat-associated protein